MIRNTPARLLIVALGANLPHGTDSSLKTLKKALKSLEEHGLACENVSGFWRTPAFPAGSGPDYVNAVAVLRAPSALDSHDVLAILHRVETEFGRQRLVRWGERTLDLDLLADGEVVAPDLAHFLRWKDLEPAEQMRQSPETLILPHPRLQDRGFVLVPMHEVAPNWRHPVLGQSVAEMLAALPAEDLVQICRI